MTHLNIQLAAAVTKRDHERLIIAAHETGHAVVELALGGDVEYVKLKFGLLGGIIGGHCRWGGEPSRDWTKDRKARRLMAMLGGDAAQTRFCRLYLGMPERKAQRYGRDLVGGDYASFDHYRAQLGMRHLSRDEALRQAARVLDRQADRLDALTARLERAKYLPGSAL
jgi:hypothetical protein